MIDLELGPVVAQTGGGVEIVEQQITADGPVSIPSGWGSAYAGFQGNFSITSGRATVLGVETSRISTMEPLGGFHLMIAGQELMMKYAHGTLTFIRID